MNSRVSVVAAAILLVAGCSREPLPEVANSLHVRPACPSRDERTYYFPEASYDDFYSSLLKRLDAPSLSCGTAVDEGYRISRLSQSRELAVVIQVVHEPSGWTLDGAEFADHASPGAGTARIANRVRKRLTNADGATVRDAFISTGFWRADPARLDTYGGVANDGQPIAIEGRRGTSYLARDGYGPLEMIQSRFFELAGPDIRDIP